MKKKIAGQVSGIFSFIFLSSLLLPGMAHAVKIVPDYLEESIKQDKLSSLLKAGRFMQAKKKIEARLINDPDNYRLLIILAYADAGLKNWADALKSIEKAIHHAPQDKKDELAVDLGNIYLIQENFVKAQSVYEGVLSKRPESTRALFSLGFLFQLTGEKLKARDYYMKVLQLDSGHQSAMKALIQIYLQEGQYEEIIPLARKLQSVAPSQETGYYFEAVAVARRTSPDYQRAVSLLNKALKIKPESKQVLFTLGYVNLRSGGYEEALRRLEEATRLDPEFFEAYKLLAVTALRQKNLTMACSHLEKALSLKPSPELYQLLGKIYLQLGQREAGVDALTKSLENASLEPADFLAAEGLYEYLGGGLEDSERKLKKALNANPDLFEPRILLLVNLLNQRKYQEAIIEAQAGLKRKPISQKLMLNLLAQAYLGMGMVNEAEKTLAKALKEDTNFIVTHLNLSAVYFRQKKYEKTEKELNFILQRNPQHLRARILLGRVYQATSDYQKAEKLIQSMLDSTHPHPVLLKEMILLKTRISQFEQALNDADTLINLYPESIEGYVLKSRVYAAMGNYQRALATIDSGLENVGDNQAALISGAKLAAAINQFERSFQYLDQYKTKYGLHRSDLKLLYARVLIETGNSKEARSFLRDELPGPEDAQKLYLLGLSWLREGDLKKAEAYLEKSTQSESRLDQAFFELARVRATLGRRIEAISLLEKAIEINPDKKQYYHALGINHEFASELDSAISVYEKGLARHPNEITFIRNIARLHLKNGNTNLAKTYAGRAMALATGEPNIPDMEVALAAHLLGLSWAREGDLKKAEEYFELAAHKGSSVGIFFYDSAKIKLLLGKTEEAIARLERAIEIQPEEEKYYLSLAVIHERSGQEDMAISVYEQGLMNKPEAVSLLNNLALLYSKKGDSQKAVSYANRMLELAPEDPNALDTVGQVYFQMQDYYKAIPYFKKASEKIPDFALFRYHLGLCYLEAGNSTEAKKELEIALLKGKNATWAQEVRDLLLKLNKK